MTGSGSEELMLRSPMLVYGGNNNLPVEECNWSFAVQVSRSLQFLVAWPEHVQEEVAGQKWIKLGGGAERSKGVEAIGINRCPDHRSRTQVGGG